MDSELSSVLSERAKTRAVGMAIASISVLGYCLIERLPSWR